MHGFAIVWACMFAALFVGHQVGDQWIQTNAQATHKGDRNRRGWLYAATHAATYTATTAAACFAVGWYLLLPMKLDGFIAGLLFSGITHLFIDRRYTLRWVCGLFGQQKVDYYDNGGAFHLDQSAHYFCLGVAAMMMTVIR